MHIWYYMKCIVYAYYHMLMNFGFSDFLPLIMLYTIVNRTNIDTI